MSETEQCRYMRAAYPTLGAEDTCSEHRHDEPTFALARAMASAFQQNGEADEQVGWCMDDAAAAVDDFDPRPDEWMVTEPTVTPETGLEFTLTINSVDYVVPQSEYEPSYPVRRTKWDAWLAEEEADDAR